jgi:hypothetical protein
MIAARRMRPISATAMQRGAWRKRPGRIATAAGSAECENGARMGAVGGKQALRALT